MPLSETTVLPAGTSSEQVERSVQVDREVGKVAVVDADHVGVDLECGLQLRSLVHFHKAVEIEVPGLGVQTIELLPLERRDYQEHRVGAGGRRLVELILVDREVLAEDRQVGVRARFPKVIERATEVRAVCEDRDRCGAPAFVGADHLSDGLTSQGKSPAEGERRLYSAIRPIPVPRAPR